MIPIKKILEHCSRELIRPTIYKLFRRTVYMLFAVLLVDFFLKDKNPTLRQTGFALCAFLFMLGAVLAYLRLDGMKIPKLPELRFHRKRKDVVPFDSIADHIDDVPEYSDDDLDEEETQVSIIIADTAAMLLAIACSFIL